MDLEAIKKRRENFDNAMREHLAAIAACHEDGEDCGYCDVCEHSEQVANEFWTGIEDDEAALIEEVERLRKARQADQATMHLITKMHASAAEMIGVLTKQLQEARAERARFYECSDIEAFPREVKDGVCYDYGSVEVHAPTVWHRAEDE